MDTARYGHTATLLDTHRILIAGGSRDYATQLSSVALSAPLMYAAYLPLIARAMPGGW